MRAFFLSLTIFLFSYSSSWGQSSLNFTSEDNAYRSGLILLNQGKYVQSTYNIISNFGIILDPNAGANTAQFEQINLKNYENSAIAYQKYLTGWYTWLSAQIIKKNKSA